MRLLFCTTIVTWISNVMVKTALKRSNMLKIHNNLLEAVSVWLSSLLFALLQAHYFVHTPTRVCPCPFCGKAYKHPQILRSHIRHRCPNNKTSEKKACYKCGKLCFIPNLQIHESKCGKHKECPVCKIKLACGTSLKSHLLIHTDSFSHQCATCGKCFSRRENLVNHLSIHTGEKPFVCADCGRAFRMKCSLQGHEKSIHGKEKVPVRQNVAKSPRRKNPTAKL